MLTKKKIKNKENPSRYIKKVKIRELFKKKQKQKKQ
jgi:hypothetical protein